MIEYARGIWDINAREVNPRIVREVLEPAPIRVLSMTTDVGRNRRSRSESRSESFIGHSDNRARRGKKRQGNKYWSTEQETRRARAQQQSMKLLRRERQVVLARTIRVASCLSSAKITDASHTVALYRIIADVVPSGRGIWPIVIHERGPTQDSKSTQIDSYAYARTQCRY